MAEVPKATTQDYIFRYQLHPEDEQVTAGVYQDRLLEMIRQQLASLLDLTIPTYRGKEVKVDGFKLLCDPDTVHELFSRMSRTDRRRRGL